MSTLAQKTDQESAIVLEGVGKTFKKSSRRRESSTIKTELIRLLRGRRKVVEPTSLIEALTDVNLTIPRGKTVGIIGRNGSGKSTLLKLMTGIYTPSRGSIRVHGRISALLELGAGFHPEFTGRENIFINGIILGMSRAQLKERIDDIIRFAELGDFIDEPVRVYSSGMFMRLAFAVATHVDPDILIIDEILSVGDEHFQHKSQAKMEEFRTSGHTIVLVTHALETVESWCDLAVWIDGGGVRRVGPPKDVVKEYRSAVASSEAAASVALLPAAPPTVLPARLRGLRLQNGAGERQPDAFTTAGRLDVVLDYEAVEATGGEFSVELRSAEGALVFGTSFGVGELLPGAGSARLEVPRLGLGSGRYEVVARLTPKGSSPAKPLKGNLTVAPDDSAEGLARPEHRWSVAKASAGAHAVEHE
jgi:lipopolysaccharide transport system ATP-binding protein